ncbi:hypothetical protein QBC34DRAFT_310905 [Podospora aff. communis PSN243]|uniref:TMEM205-like domain-containing protein n=1 Tax=Podospora aff. communis PSN243 TaxID=3040156 RepID=A0AAV9G7H0_9PEZI|nr:hypothetical protein QBC34DRAFT_310905 [Podospora aff. communis PSN243]
MNPTLLNVFSTIHLLSYSTLLGTSLYQSFILTKLAYRSLPRSSFISLQKAVFPVYFRLQTGLLILSAVTVPPFGLPFGGWSLVTGRSKWDLIPFCVAGMSGALNLGVYEGRTRRLMLERVERDKRLRDSVATVYGAADSVERTEGPSDEMKRLNRLFSKNHAMCIHLNLVTMVAMLFYGWRLASRISIEVL